MAATTHIETVARQSLLAKKITDGGYTIPARRQPSLVNNHTLEDVKRNLIVALNSGSEKLVLRSLDAFRKQHGKLHASLREIERQARERMESREFAKLKMH